MNATPDTHVLLVEDDELLRSSLVSLLRMSGFRVTGVGDGLSFYKALGDAPPDVAVLDLGLPDQAGETLIDYLRRNTTIPIIVITARDSLDTRLECYRTGADLFLGKPVDGRELAAAIASLAGRRRGDTPTRPTPPADAPWVLDIPRHALLTPAGEAITLTAMEWQFVATVAEGADHGARRRDLLVALYGRDDESAEHALETLVRRTRQKIADVLGAPAPIQTEYGVGYRFGARLVIQRD
ncbi:response regulator transcription factor [Luteitalea sp.]|jgi:DNA-binding response OmpR family regulator|uniref:response regulator transcription factor n=1 Tax=Luteitalea sp. TaxID=2004800 RepID=UPI0037C8D21E